MRIYSAPYGRTHQMIVQVVLIQMGADNDLIPFAKQPLGKFQSDGVRLLRRDLTRLKGLYEVIAEDTACLSKLLLGFHHLRKSGVHAAAIQHRSEKELLRLFGIRDVGDAGRQRGFFSISDVMHTLVQPCADGKYFCVCHYPRFTALHNAACISMML